MKSNRLLAALIVGLAACSLSRMSAFAAAGEPDQATAISAAIPSLRTDNAVINEAFRIAIGDLMGNPMAALSWAFGKLRDDDDSDEPEEQETILPAPDLASVDEILADSRTDAGVNRVGRNDPCPCGSGKKYKKCCMRKQQN